MLRLWCFYEKLQSVFLQMPFYSILLTSLLCYTVQSQTIVTTLTLTLTLNAIRGLSYIVYQALVRIMHLTQFTMFSSLLNSIPICKGLRARLHSKS